MELTPRGTTILFPGRARVALPDQVALMAVGDHMPHTPFGAVTGSFFHSTHNLSLA